MQGRLPRLGAVFCLLAAGCVHRDAQATKYGGTWTMAFGTRTFLVLTVIERGGKIGGTLARPERFQTGNTGFRFTHISVTSVQEPILSASEERGRLHFVTASSKNGEGRSDYVLLPTQTPDQVTLKLADAPFDPWILTKHTSGSRASVSTDWDPARSYSPEDGLSSNAEMQRIFGEDQKGRQNFTSLSREQQTALAAQDADRRRQTQQLLADGRLHTGEDFKQASFVFQHGDTSDDYLLAHTLATVAVANGDTDAVWIASATLDRYLQSIGQTQVCGTQFLFGADKAPTQDPYNRDLISDALRRELDVPAIATQLQQFESFVARSKSTGNAK